ncbi:MAG: DUF4446 family protein [Clostridia bacterium]|nr:DUF4446 family protein [Clostridia bacterium]
MENLLQVLKTEDYLVISCIVNIILVIVTMINVIMLTKINKKYIKFMKQLGNGSNLDEMLRDYLRDVKEIKQDNSEIKAYYTKLDSDIASCIQKVGLVRYNAFRDVGSDLSFAIALLDGNDTGVVLNGLYGSESSNIYAKPIKGGVSTYQLSEEEKYALEIAEQTKNFVAKNRKQ